VELDPAVDEPGRVPFGFRDSRVDHAQDGVEHPYRLRDGFVMSSSMSTGRFRRTHGQSPWVLMVGAAKWAP
jgi:hypothetical protein